MFKSLTDALSGRLRPAIKLLRNLNMPVALLQGEVESGTASILVSDQSPVAETLARSLLSGEASRSDHGTVPLWKLDSQLRSVDGVDLSIAHADRLAAERFFGGDCLRIPDTVSMWLETPRDFEGLKRSNGSLKDDLRRVQRNGMTMKVEGRETDFDTFYNRFYLPYVRDRHGALVFPRDPQWLKDRLIEGGAMIWVETAEGRIAASIVQAIGDVLHSWVLGVRDGDPVLMKSGAVSAIYRFTVEYAQQRGCTSLNLGLCKANLRDGVLQYKRKWGTEMRRNGDNSNYLMIRWRAWNRNVAAFLAMNPLVHEGEKGLIAITATGLSRVAGQEDLDQIIRLVLMRGLHLCLIVNEDGWEPGVVAPEGVRLLAGAPLPAEFIAIS